MGCHGCTSPDDSCSQRLTCPNCSDTLALKPAWTWQTLRELAQTARAPDRIVASWRAPGEEENCMVSLTEKTTIPLPAAEVWPLLNDPALVASCIPGAALALD